MSQKTS
ncbi:hypothetical protein D049_5216A, partial [Vibrio parahaemolyticus VPTS-2010]